MKAKKESAKSSAGSTMALLWQRKQIGLFPNECEISGFRVGSFSGDLVNFEHETYSQSKKKQKSGMKK